MPRTFLPPTLTHFAGNASLTMIRILGHVNSRGAHLFKARYFTTVRVLAAAADALKSWLPA
jgi:hypothetical protein